MRLILNLPDGIRISDVVAATARLGLSPDGKQLGFIGVDAANQRLLWLHALNEPAARKVDGSLLAAGPIWSPDGRSLLFAVFNPSGSPLKRLSMDGGAPVTIADRAGPTAWAPDGTLLVEPFRGERALLRMSSNGGASART